MATTNRLYVGNIPFKMTESDLRDFFSPRQVSNVKIIMDRETGRPRGFAFVELTTAEDARSAVADLDGHEVDGRRIVVNEAREREGGGGGNRNGNGKGRDRNRGGRQERRSRDDDYAKSWK